MGGRNVHFHPEVHVSFIPDPESCPLSETIFQPQFLRYIFSILFLYFLSIISVQLKKTS